MGYNIALRSILFQLASLLSLLFVLEPGAWVKASSLSLAAQAGFNSNVAGQGKEEVRSLEPGEPIESELAGGQGHIYQIVLSAGQFLNVTVEQRGIDVVVRLLGPDGKLISEFDSENRKQGQEVVSQVAEVAGSHRLNVQAKEKGAPAGRYAIRVVELRAATEKDRELEEARKLLAESLRLELAGKYDEARPLAERALEIREKALGPEHPDVAASIHSLAILDRAKGDYVRAETLNKRALAIREKALGPEHPDVARSIHTLAILYDDKGDYAKAEPLFKRALSIREKALGPDHVHVANSLNSLAILYRAKGDYAEAEPLYQRALAIRERALGSESPDVSASLNNLANLYKASGDYAKAEPLFQRALANVEKALGPEHPDVAAYLNNLASLCRARGDYVKAEPLYQRALAISEKTLGPQHPDVALSLHNFANLYMEKGDYAKAELLYQRALTIWEKALGAEHPYVAASLNSLASLYRAKGDYAMAVELYQRALAIREKVLGLEHPHVATSLNNLGNLHYHEGDYVKAEPLMQRALAISEKALGPQHPDVSLCLNSLASLHYSKGDYAKAESLFQRALAIRERALGPEHPDVALSLFNLARLYAAKGELSQAIAFQSRASALSERNIALNLATGSERQKLAYLALLSAQANQTISLHVYTAPNDPKARRLAATTILQRKGRVLDATSDSLGALRRRFNAQDQALLDRLKETNARVARLVLAGPQRTSLAEHQKRVEGLDEQREKLEAEISSRSAEFRAQSQTVTLDAVQSAIPGDAALVEFYGYRPNAKYGKPDEQFSRPRYVAYVLRRQGEPQWVELGEAKAIDDAVATWRQALRNPRRADVQRLARQVDERVMRPVRALLSDTSRVLISPDGSLNLIPFAALVDERGHYLVERYSFSHLSSGRDLLRLQVPAQSKQGPFIIADPAFGELAGANTEATRGLGLQSDLKQPAAQGAGLTQVYFRPLPRTAEEARTLKTILPQSRLLTGEQATEAALKRVSGPSVLHIATHGFFLEDLQEKPANARSSGPISEPQSAAANIRIENPLLRSGLALAGANQRESGEDDGVLTALEVAGLDLWGTKLVVLSACDTGVGEIKNGEGVYGLRRALVLAGSESQVMSLWPVSDKSTRDLMVAYYTALAQGQGRSEALRAVQLKTLSSKNRQHPYYWAGFIHSGEWANLEGKR